MVQTENQIIGADALIREAIEKLNHLGTNLTLFVIDENQVLVGTLTDGDVRRGFLAGAAISESISTIMCADFRYLVKNEYDLAHIDEFRKKNIHLVPVLDKDRRITRIINLNEKKSILPIDAVLMAGGEGRRLRPLTEHLPKPMLKVGDKPIIEYNIDRLADYGVEHIYISVNYMADKIKDYFLDGSSRQLQIGYIDEDKPLGTIGAVNRVKDFAHDTILVMNSDLLTTIDFEEFYREFIERDADFMVATIPYHVSVPYAVLETKDGMVHDFKEKPTYTYYSNAGIYLIKKEVLSCIPQDQFYNATDLMEEVMKCGKRLLSFPILGYWLDIGRHEDYIKAQEDIKHLKLN